MRYIPNTPEGTRDRLFGECQERRRVQSALTGLFARRGYSEIITPEEEFYDLFTGPAATIRPEQMVKLIDRTGKVCVLRPDCTTPIARVAATRLKDMPLPQRFYYDQTVYRSGREHMGQHREIPQCGIELIGAEGERADLEVIVAAVDSLRTCGLERFHIELGHAGIFTAIAGTLAMDQETQETMRGLIEGKNYAALNDLLSHYPDLPGAWVLGRLPYLFGGVEVLEEARRLTGDLPALHHLRRLYDQLEAAGYGRFLRFDLGLVQNIDYYTGIVFRGYAEGAGEAVLSGGRYDQLCAGFGRPAQAVGFAVNVDEVAKCLEVQEAPGLQSLIHFEGSQLGLALRLLECCAPGTCELSPWGTLEETKALAREKGVRTIQVLTSCGIEEVSPE